MSHIRKAIKPGPCDYEHNDVKLLLKRNEKATIGNSPRRTDFIKGTACATNPVKLLLVHSHNRALIVKGLLL